VSAQRAAKSKSSAPPFRTEVYVESYEDVEITASELEEAGWIYVGKGKSIPSTQTVLDVVRRWHDDTHDGPWQWCQHDLCDTLRGRPYPESNR
jgi:hypothetical protein